MSTLDFVRRPNSGKILDEGFGNINSNGSIMRISPVAIAYHNDIKLAT